MAVRIEDTNRVAPVNVPIPTPRPFMPQAPSVGLDPAVAVPDVGAAGGMAPTGPGAGGATGAPSDPAVPDFSGEPTDEDAALWVGISAGMQAKTDTDNPLYNGILGFIEAKKARDSFMSQARDKAREREMEDEERQWRREDRGFAAEDRSRARKLQDSAEARAAARFDREGRRDELDYLNAAYELETKINGGAPLDGDEILKAQKALETAAGIAEKLYEADAITEEEYQEQMRRIAARASALDEAILRRQVGGTAGAAPGAEGEPVVPDAGAAPPAETPPAEEGGSGILGMFGAAKEGVSNFFAPGGTLDTYNAGHAAAGTPNPFRDGVTSPAVAGEPLVPDRADALDTYLNPNAPPMPREDRAPAPAEQQPSDVFPTEGEIVGDGSLQNPRQAPDLDPEQVKQWASLHLQPGDFFVWRGGKYRMK